MNKRHILAGLACMASSAAYGASTPQLQIDQAAITGGNLVIAGRTAKPNQVVTLTNTGDRTASLPSRKFSFSLSYLPETCKVNLQVENDELKDVLVAGCAPRSKDGADGVNGKDGINGKDGKDGSDGLAGKDGLFGKDGAEGITYGSLQGDGAAFKCWPSDMVGLWFIKDYPKPNSRTIARIVPDGPGANGFKVMEPGDPLLSENPKGSGVTQWAEYERERLVIVSRDTNQHTGMYGEFASDCKSIVWRGAGENSLSTWER